MLDIHHIATGRGDATLVVSPLGHLALIDAGAVIRHDPALVEATPNASRSPGAWIGAYVAKRMRETGRNLDAIAVTHLHEDHVAGLADVVARFPSARLLDRTWPDYGYPPFEGPAARAYAELARNRTKQGRTVERLVVGTSGQVLKDEHRRDQSFSIRCVAAGGRVWTGVDEIARDVFPPRDLLCRRRLAQRERLLRGLSD